MKKKVRADRCECGHLARRHCGAGGDNRGICRADGCECMRFEAVQIIDLMARLRTVLVFEGEEHELHSVPAMRAEDSNG